MKKIVITGATGAIGIALIQKCIEEEIEVLALCHRKSTRISFLPNHPLLRIVELDLDELGSQTLICDSSYEIFIHLGWDGTFGNARNNMPVQIRNIGSSIDAVHLAKKLGCHTFIGAGSQAEYGRYEGILSPNTKTNPENGYGMAKLCAGQMSRQVCCEYGIRHIWTRIFSVYGPYDGINSMIISSVLKMLNGEKASFTAAEQQWDYLYSLDAANALYLLAKHGHDGKTYCIGSGQTKALKEYIEEMKNRINPSLPLGIGELTYAEKQVMHLQADISDLVSDTGSLPQISFEEGIERTIQWVKETLWKK